MLKIKGEEAQGWGRGVSTCGRCDSEAGNQAKPSQPYNIQNTATAAN